MTGCGRIWAIPMLRHFCTRHWQRNVAEKPSHILACGKDSAEVFVRVSAQSIAGEELRQLRLGMLGAVEWPTRMREGRKGTIRNILEHLKMVTLKMALLQSECVFQTYFRGIPGLFVVEGSMEAVVVVSCNNYSWNIQVNLEIAKQSDVKLTISNLSHQKWRFAKKQGPSWILTLKEISLDVCYASLVRWNLTFQHCAAPSESWPSRMLDVGEGWWGYVIEWCKSGPWVPCHHSLTYATKTRSFGALFQVQFWPGVVTRYRRKPHSCCLEPVFRRKAHVLLKSPTFLYIS